MNLFSETTAISPGPDYFQRLAETLPGIIWIARTDGSIEYINHEGNEFTGLPPDDSYDWGWWTLMHPEDLGRAQSEWQGAMAEGRELRGNWRIKRKDGAYRWMQVRARPLSNSHGVIDKWFGLTVDITAEIELQEELRAAEHLASESLTMLETLQASTPVGFGYVDRDYRFVRVNWMLAAMCNVPLVEIPGKLVSEVAPDVWPQLEKVFREVMETGMPARNVEIIGEIPGKPGEVSYGLLNCHPTTKDDEITGVGMVAVDITARQRSQEFKSAVLSNLSDGVYAIDMDGKINYVNDAAMEMTGYEADEMLGADAHDLLHFQHADRSPFLQPDCELYKARISGSPKRGDDAPFTRKDGSIFIANYALTPLKAGEVMYGAVIVFHDPADGLPAAEETPADESPDPADDSLANA